MSGNDVQYLFFLILISKLCGKISDFSQVVHCTTSFLHVILCSSLHRLLWQKVCLSTDIFYEHNLDDLTGVRTWIAENTKLNFFGLSSKSIKRERKRSTPHPPLFLEKRSNRVFSFLWYTKLCLSFPILL